jgi:hypothetical protein
MSVEIQEEFMTDIDKKVKPLLGRVAGRPVSGAFAGS